MKIWKLGVDTGKRDDSQQYQLPVKNEKKLYLLNILCVADALDLNNIIATYNGGAITYIRKFSLIKEKIPKAPIFKVICEGSIYTDAAFVTEAFKENVDGLMGFRFEEVGDF